MATTVEQRSDGVAVLHPSGRINLTTARAMRATIEETVKAGSHRVLVDLGEVQSMDSSGLGALVAGLKTARQAGGDLRLAGANEQVRFVLRLTNLDRVFVPYERLDEAYEDA